MMVLEGNLLEAAAILNSSSLSYSLSAAIDPLSLLADFDLPNDTVKALADQVPILPKFTNISYISTNICNLNNFTFLLL
jgi:hypothetical protein